MGKGYLIDTNSVIDYLNNKLPEKANRLIENIDCQISVITRNTKDFDRINRLEVINPYGY